jgi:hypothetical protein
MFGQHGMRISNSKHLIGNFNAHLQDCCFLYADESIYAGNHAQDNMLKGLITDDTLIIERKGIDAVSMPNRLKIVMASNNDWVVSASSDERRYFVLEVSSQYRGKNAEYFTPLRLEMASKQAGCISL